MAYIYAMSDIHGCLDAFEDSLSLVDLSGDNKLVLLGDYIHGPDSFGVLDKIMRLQQKYGSHKIIALLGNHEEMALDGTWPIQAGRHDYDNEENENDEKYLIWMEDLPRYYSEGNTIFVHAGIDEELGELWEWTDDYIYTEKFPAQTGKFFGDLKIVAGHAGTFTLAGDERFHDIYFDGESHYYIDGSVLDSGVIPIIKVDMKKNKYYKVTDSGDFPILPYDEEC